MSPDIAMSAREAVLDRIRRALAPPAAAGGNGSRPDLPRPDVSWPDVPDVGRGVTGDELLELFVERVEDYRATVRVVPAAELVAAIVEALRLRGSTRVVVPAGLSVVLPDELDVQVDGRPPGAAAAGRVLGTRDLDAVNAVVTRSVVGIAETGTIALDAGPDQGRRALTLVPDHHICIVRETDIVETVPQGLARLDPRRPLTLISGPSATSDIELSRVEGVHGPRLLDVIVERG